MPAIKPHSTATSGASWDGPQAKANLKNDGTEAYYRSAFAWQDPDGDPQAKGTYKFIHHNVSSSGEVGAANLTACSAGIAALNGGRGGADIPDSDRRGVWSHLAKHLKDAGREPPELKDEPAAEEKQYACHMQLKELTQDGQFEGYAAIFGNIDLQGDRIKRGAFKETLEETGGRWPILMGHMMARPVGFSITGEEDNKGLKVLGEFTLDSRDGQDAYASARHAARLKQPLGLSIGYRIRKDGAEYNSDTGVRHLTALDVLEFSVATVPANPRARVSRVKSAGERWSVRECEEILRDAGFSQSEAKCLIFSLKGQRDVEPDATALLAPDPKAVAFLDEVRSCNLIVQVKDLLCLKAFN
jgi:HK97 family phage prohead protease